jgi:glycosyltransferase involved in cell wall biosynthesis
MQVLIDIRSLQSGRTSGVENYILNTVERLLTQIGSDRYTLFSCGIRSKGLINIKDSRVETVHRRIPNKFVNLLTVLGIGPTLENLAGDTDIVWMPNLNLYRLKKTTKFALTIHDLSPVVLPEYYDMRRRMWHHFANYKQSIERADIIFAVSHFTKQTLVDTFKIKEDKVVVTHLGVDKEKYNNNLSEDYLKEVRNSLHLPPEYILSLSTIEPRKNLIRLLDAYKVIKSGAHLILAGSLGWKYQEILKVIERHPKRQSIHLIGPVSESSKPALIKMARVLAYPSLYEGFGLVPLEAMAVGTPVLTSNITSLPEICGDSALLVDPYQVDDIAFGLESLIESESLRLRYIKKGLVLSQKYDWDSTVVQIKEGFANLMKS